MAGFDSFSLSGGFGAMLKTARHAKGKDFVDAKGMTCNTFERKPAASRLQWSCAEVNGRRGG